MRKIFTLLIVAILATATSWAAEYTITFGNKAGGATQIQASLKASTAITGGKDYVTANPFTVSSGTCYYGGGSADEKASVRLGKKNAASSLTIALSETGKVKASSIVVNCKQMNDNSAGGTLAVNGLASQEFPSSASDLTYTFSEPTNITSIELEATKSVYVYSITVTYTESSEPQKKVTSLAITGEPTNKEYFVGDAFSTDGLKVNATYDDATQEDVTTKATWAFTPATFTEAGAVSVTATATYGGVSAETTCPVTVKTIANTKETAYTVEQAIALIDAGKDLATPVYVKGIVSEITTPYSTQYKNISFNVSDDGTTTVPQFEFFRNQKDAENKYAEDPNIKVGATVIGYGTLTKFGQTYEFNAGNYLVEYTAPAEKAVASIAISGEPTKKEYFLNEKFSPEGLVVTATYDDASTADVTANATWTFDPAVFNTTGSVTVTALAAYGGKDGVAEYTVTVSAKPLKLTITPATGTYTSAQTVTIEANNAVGDVAIYYTTDGSDPADGANEYTAPFEVATTTTVKAYAFDDELREATAESVITIKASTFAEENFSGCNTQGGRDNNFSEGSGTLSDESFDCSGWKYETSYTANSCVRVGTSKNGTLTSPVVAGTNYNAISFDIAGWDDSKVNTLTVTINNGGTFADETTSKSFTATNAKWTTFTEKITGLTSATTFTFSGKRLFLDSIILMNASTLAELAENGEEGKEYTVNDEMVVAKKFQKGDKNYIVVKDAAQAVRNVSAPTDDDKFFNINGNKQEKYAQNNWMLVSLPVELYNQLNEKSTVTSITGSLTEKFNVAMEATKVVFENATNNFAPNTYCPINFMGESSVKGTNPAYTSSYYFATPKANEYANVVWAVYNDTDGAFYLPVHQGSANAQEFKAAFKVDYSLNSVATPELVDGDMYSFEALVKEVAVATTDAKSAPRKTAYDSTVAPSTKFVVYPLDLDANKVATGVNDVNSAKEVKGVSYFNMMGVESAQPFDGVNIMVTTYTDGTSSAAKVLR